MDDLEAMLGARDEALRTKKEKVPAVAPVPSSSSAKSSYYYGRCIVEIEEPEERYINLFLNFYHKDFPLIHIALETLQMMQKLIEKCMLCWKLT